MRALDVTGIPRAPARQPPGTGALCFARNARRTVVARAFASSPLKLLQPQNAGTAAWVYASTYGGGLVDGDRVSLTIGVERGASALVSTQASTKVYRSPAGTASHLSARVDDDAMLVVMPDPVVCFAGANYRQVQEFDLAAGGALVLVDWITSGRRAFGERWKADNYDGRILIRQNGRLIIYDALLLRQADGVLERRLGRFNAFAFVAVIGPPLLRHADHVVSQGAGLPVGKRSDLLQATSPIGRAGCVVRIAGVSVEDVAHAIRDALSFLPRLLGDDPWTRKW